MVMDFPDNSDIKDKRQLSHLFLKGRGCHLIAIILDNILEPIM